MVSVATLLYASAGNRREEFAHQPGILDPRSALDPRRDIDDVWPEGAYSRAHVARPEAAGEDDGGAASIAGKINREVAPGQSLPGPTELLVAPGIEHDRVGAVEQRFGFMRYVSARDSDRRPDLSSEFCADCLQIGGRGIVVELHDVELRLLRGPSNFVRVVRTKYSHVFYLLSGALEDLPCLSGRNAPRPIGKHDPDVARADLRTDSCVLGPRHPAELNLCEHLPSVLRV